MNAILVNLLSATFRASVLPEVLVRYLAAVAGLLVLSWPISDLVGRQAPPAVFPIMAFVQALAVPFLVNSFVTGRLELRERISAEDWIAYTPVSTVAAVAAHVVWAVILASLLLAAGLPFTLAALPLAGDSWLTLGAVYLTVLAITALTSAFGYIVLVILPADWVTSAAVDAAVAMWFLLTLDGGEQYAPISGPVTVQALGSYLSPTKSVLAALSAQDGLPWGILVPIAGAVVLVLLGGIVGHIVRMQGAYVESD